MLFNSFEFLLFFPIVTLIYFVLPHKFRWFHLLVASSYFYMAFIPKYILILFGLIVIDYLAGLAIEKSVGKSKKTVFISAVVINVCILAFFKYYIFFVADLNKWVEALDVGYFTFPMVLLLPLGISFHVFQ